MNTTLQLRKFDISKSRDLSTVILLGKRNTGKSIMAADWLFHKRHAFAAGILMSATEEVTRFFRKQCGIPNEFVYHEFDPDVIQNIIDKQKAWYRDVEAGRKEPRQVFIVLDDIFFDAKDMFKEKAVRFLFMNGRHIGIFLLITAQSLELPPYVRDNVDYVCVLRQPSNFVRDKLYKTLFSQFPSYKYFCQVLDNCTENYECLVFDQTQQSNKVVDCFGWYKAKLRPDGSWKMGSERFHGFNKGKHTQIAQMVTSNRNANSAAKKNVQVIKVGRKK